MAGPYYHYLIVKDSLSTNFKPLSLSLSLTYWLLSSCCIILPVYTTLHQYYHTAHWFGASYSFSSTLLCLLTLPVGDDYIRPSHIKHPSWGSSIYVPRGQCVKAWCLSLSLWVQSLSISMADWLCGLTCPDYRPTEIFTTLATAEDGVWDLCLAIYNLLESHTMKRTALKKTESWKLPLLWAMKNRMCLQDGSSIGSKGRL